MQVQVRAFFIGIYLILLSSGIESQQWQITNGPSGGAITAIAADDTTLIAGSWNCGIFKSTDNGMTWNPLDTSYRFGGQTLSALLLQGNTIIAGTTGGLCVSSDQGKNWKYNSAFDQIAVNVLIKKDTAFFAGTTYGVFRSSGNGTNWIAANSGLPLSAQILSLTASGPYLIAGTSAGIFIFEDEGDGWRATGTGQPEADTVFALAAEGNTVFAGANGGIYRSSDNGASWISSSGGLTPGQSISAIAIQGDFVFAGSRNNGLFLSSDKGSSWKKVNTGLTRTSVLNLLSHGRKVFVGTSGAGLLVSADNGTTWSSPVIWLRYRAQITALCANGTGLMAGTPAGVFFSINNGDDWIPTNSGLPENCQAGNIISIGTTYFLLSDKYHLYASRDNGANWVSIENGPADTIVYSLASDGSALYAVMSSGIFASADTGKSWKSINGNLSNAGVQLLAADNNGLFALIRSGEYSKVYYTNDNGAHWSGGYSYSNGRKTGTGVISFYATSNYLLAGFYSYDRGNENGLGVFYSTNNGVTFTAANSGLPSSLYVYDFRSQGNRIFIGTGSGVFLSNDAHFDWIALNSGLPAPYRDITHPFREHCVQCLAMNESYVFAGTNLSGIFRLPLTSISAEQPSITRKPSAVRFSTVKKPEHKVQISFYLCRPERITITMHVLSGRAVSTIADANFAAGPHLLSWDTRKMAAGCYVLRAHAGPNSSMKILMVSR